MPAHRASTMHGAPKIKVALAIVAGSLVFAAPAWAYWDFQGNLPRPDGTRIYVKVTNSSQYQPIRMSWTSGTHCMRYLRIVASGSWNSWDVCGPSCTTFGPYDCVGYFTVTTIWDKFGCYNPPNLSTVWVNCRATAPL
jgi:hypothetical protein